MVRALKWYIAMRLCCHHVPAILFFSLNRRYDVKVAMYIANKSTTALYIHMHVSVVNTCDFYCITT